MNMLHSQPKHGCACHMCSFKNFKISFFVFNSAQFYGAFIQKCNISKNYCLIWLIKLDLYGLIEIKNDLMDKKDFEKAHIESISTGNV